MGAATSAERSTQPRLVFSPDVHQRIRNLHALVTDNIGYNDLGKDFANKLQYYIHDVVNHSQASRPPFDDPDLNVIWELSEDFVLGGKWTCSRDWGHLLTLYRSRSPENTSVHTCPAVL